MRHWRLTDEIEVPVWLLALLAFGPIIGLLVGWLVGMRTLLLAPHADDETLFASYLAQKWSAHIAVVFDEGRERELRLAATTLGCSHQQIPLSKGSDDDFVEAALIGLRDSEDWGRVISPDVEVFGHAEHNQVGRLTFTVFRDLDIIRYRTYAPRGTRTHGVPSVPEQPEFIARKLFALSCYRSQIEAMTTRPWFYDLLDMREWTA